MTQPVTARVLTISDRCARGEMTDTAGPAVSETLSESLGARVEPVRVLPDERDEIESALRDAVHAGVALVVTVGGTGCGPRDVTPEATRAVVERDMPGLGEAMRRASAEVTPRAYLARGIAGIARRTLILNLPGSRKGAIENLLAIAAILPHALDLVAGRTAHDAADAGRGRDDAHTGRKAT